MTFNQREYRSPDSRAKQILIRLHHEAGSGSRAITAFAAICDMISIPRDLRAGLLDELVREGYVTQEGERLRLTEAGQGLASEPGTSPPVEGERNPAPNDRESRARTPGTGRR